MKVFITRKNLIRYVSRNPGLTATQITVLMRPKGTVNGYTPASVLNVLHELAKNGKLVKRQLPGARTDAKVGGYLEGVRPEKISQIVVAITVGQSQRWRVSINKIKI